MLSTPLDAIPDLSDVQVIIFTEYPGQAPQVVEDQVTYPLTTAMLAVPFAKVVRGYSFFGFSFVYIIFEDGTDLYWARSRVLEYLNFVAGRLPAGGDADAGAGRHRRGLGLRVHPVNSDRHDLQQLRSIQDWYLRYELTSVPGVSEVACIGGYVKQYQVAVDPNKLRAYNIPLQKVRMAIQRSNNDVGGRLVEMGETEFMVRGLGYIKSLDDLEKHRRWAWTSGAPRSCCATWPTSSIGPETAARARRIERRGRGGRRHRRDAFRRERPGGHRQRQGEARRARSQGLPEGVRDQRRSTTAPG